MKKIITTKNKEWREKWYFFWLRYYSLSEKSRENYWNAMKEHLAE